jgi:hypothetical protein
MTSNTQTYIVKTAPVYTASMGCSLWKIMQITAFLGTDGDAQLVIFFPAQPKIRLPILITALQFVLRFGLVAFILSFCLQRKEGGPIYGSGKISS